MPSHTAPKTAPAVTPHRNTIELVTGHFRERAGYAAYRPHGTGDYLLIHTLAGRGRFGFAGADAVGEIIAHPGDIVLLRPGTLHDYGVEPALLRWEFLWTHFQPRTHWLEWLSWPEEAPGLHRLRLGGPALRRERSKVVEAFAAAHRFSTGAQRRRTAFAMAALEQVLLWCDAANPRADQARLDERVRAAMDFLCRRLAEPLTLEVLAAHVNLSVSRLSHLFRDQAGVTPQQFLETQRLSRAKQLLELTPHAVKQIAREVGFGSPFYFSLRFKRHAGVSPRAYRARLAAADAGRRR